MNMSDRCNKRWINYKKRLEDNGIKKAQESKS